MPPLPSPSPSQTSVAPKPSNTQIATASRLPQWQRRSVYASTALLSATGFLWLLLYFFYPVGEGQFLEASQPQKDTTLAMASMWSVWSVWSVTLAATFKAWLIRLHAAAALWFCMVVGSLLPLHILSALSRRQNRVSGLSNVAAFSMLLVSGYALWYAPEGGFRLSAQCLHWGVGAALPLCIWLHVRGGHNSSQPKI